MRIVLICTWVVMLSLLPIHSVEAVEPAETVPSADKPKQLTPASSTDKDQIAPNKISVIEKGDGTELESIDPATLNLSKGEIIVATSGLCMVKTPQANIGIRDGATVLVSIRPKSCKVQSLLEKNLGDVRVSASGKYTVLNAGEEALLASNSEEIFALETEDGLARKSALSFSPNKELLLQRAEISLRSLVQSARGDCLKSLVNSAAPVDKLLVQKLVQNAHSQDAESRRNLSEFGSFALKPKPTILSLKSDPNTLDDETLKVAQSDSWKTISIKGDKAVCAKRYEEADTLYRQAFSLAEKDHDATTSNLCGLLLKQALTRQRLGKNEDAAALVNKSLSLLPNETASERFRNLQRIYLASLYEKQHLDKEANSVLAEIGAVSSTLPSSASLAEKLQAQIISAYGGVSRINLYRESAFEFRGKKYLTVANSRERAKTSSACESQFDGDRFLTTGQYAGATLRSGFDGVHRWNEFNNNTLILSKTEQQAEDRARHRSLYEILGALSNTRPSQLKPEKFGDQNCDGLSFVMGGTNVSLWCNTTSHLIVRIKMECKRDSSSIPQYDWDEQTDYSNYHSYAGYWVPMDVLIEINKIQNRMTWDEYEFLPPLALPVFEPPIQKSLANPISIPFEVKGKKICIATMVNEIKGLATIDTGAAITTITNAFANSSGVVPLKGAAPQKLSGLFSSSNVRPSEIQALDLGGRITLEHAPVYVSEPIEQTSDSIVYQDGKPVVVSNHAAPRMELNVGSDLLRRFSVKIDFDTDLLTLSEIPAPLGPDSLALPMPVYGNDAFLEGQVADMPSEFFLLDTGSFREVLINTMYSKSRNLSAVSTKGKVIDINGKTSSVRRGSAGSLRLSKLHLSNPEMDFVTLKEWSGKFHFYNILGLKFFNHFRAVTFDYPKELLILEPRHPWSEISGQMTVESTTK